MHRDIKPANLFVARLGSEYDYLKVLDFGIVKDRPGQEAMLLTAQGMVQGTPAFMAPEIVVGETDVDGRADLYSLACAAYWALTGQLVFAAKTPEQMLLHHAQTTPVPPSQVSELPIPRALDEIVMRCLEKNPARSAGVGARSRRRSRRRGLRSTVDAGASPRVVGAARARDPDGRPRVEQAGSIRRVAPNRVRGLHRRNHLSVRRVRRVRRSGTFLTLVIFFY